MRTLIWAAIILTGIVGCQKAKTKTISGEFRSEYDVRREGAVYDFRSDGTYSFHYKVDLGELKQSFDTRGTYTIEGNELILMQTYWIHKSDKTEEIRTELSQITFTIEPNGDLVSGAERLKKQ